MERLKTNDNARLLPPLIVYEEMGADRRKFGVGFIPCL